MRYLVIELPTHVQLMPAVSALYVRQNVDAELLPTGLAWSVEYKTDDGAYVYAIDYHRTSGDIPSARFDNSTALNGLIRGTKMLVEVKEVDGIRYATRVAVDEDAEYPECPRCAFMHSLSVTTPQKYLDDLKVFQQIAAEGYWEMTRYDVPQEKLFYSSDKALLRIRCLDCRAEYACRTADDREAAGIHYTRLRHSFVDL